MSNALKVGQRVKIGEDDFGVISQIAEEYHAKYDDYRTIITIKWDFNGAIRHLLGEFKRHGGHIEELPIQTFQMYFDTNGIGIALTGRIDLGNRKKIELSEHELRRLIASGQAALDNI